ncbi:MAG: hypothetical protein NZL87_09660, partial [Thermomicrobium sp.]|nr:hypothetical protein [Thermomicrobium sp.]
MTTSEADHDPLVLLRRVFDLERRKGYTDTAAVGGLERFLERNLALWLTQEPAYRTRLQELAAILQGYRTKSPPERAELLAHAHSLLDGAGGTPPRRAPISAK